MAPSDPQTPVVTAPQAASLPRRLGAMVYDCALLFAVLAVAVWLLIYPYELILAEPFPNREPLYRTLEQIYLLAIIVGFYSYFWTHGGQTLGLRAWRLRLVREDGGPVCIRDALRRLGWATLSLLPAGLGLWWCLIDREGLAWHDRRSRTRLVTVH